MPPYSQIMVLATVALGATVYGHTTPTITAPTTLETRLRRERSEAPWTGGPTDPSPIPSPTRLQPRRKIWNEDLYPQKPVPAPVYIPIPFVSTGSTTTSTTVSILTVTPPVSIGIPYIVSGVEKTFTAYNVHDASYAYWHGEPFGGTVVNPEITPLPPSKCPGMACCPEDRCHNGDSWFCCFGRQREIFTSLIEAAEASSRSRQMHPHTAGCTQLPKTLRNNVVVGDDCQPVPQVPAEPLEERVDVEPRALGGPPSGPLSPEPYWWRSQAEGERQGLNYWPQRTYDDMLPIHDPEEMDWSSLWATDAHVDELAYPKLAQSEEVPPNYGMEWYGGEG